ncbi:MAG TPA: tetratricopeptide repeat protein [Acidobacteriota bacterium]
MRDRNLLAVLGFLIVAAGTALLASGCYLWWIGVLPPAATLLTLLGIGIAAAFAGALLLSGPSWFDGAARDLPQSVLAEPYLRNARAAVEEGQTGVALTLCQRALEVDPSNVAALLEMAHIYQGGADEVRALKLYNQALDRLGTAGRGDPLFQAARDGIAEIMARHPATDPAGELDIK